MVTAMVTVAYGMTVVFSYLPKYMNDVYKLNTSEVHIFIILFKMHNKSHFLILK